MSVEANKAVCRQVLEDLVTDGRFEVVDAIYASSFDFFDVAAGQTITTPEGLREYTRGLRTRMPGIRITIDEEIADGDAVVHRWTARGTDEATGKAWSMPGISIYHLHEGRIVSEYVLPHALGRRQQLGLVPAPRPTSD
jgi:hypothetical protein